MPPCIAQQRRHSAIAITTILPRQRYDILGERRFVIRPAGRLALCRSMLPEHAADPQIGRASCRERVCQYVLISVVAVSVKHKKEHIPTVLISYQHTHL